MTSMLVVKNIRSGLVFRAVLGVCLALTACGSAESPESDAKQAEPEALGNVTPFGVAFEPDSLSGPGTSLFGEIEVQEGSQLVGPVFPSASVTGPGGNDGLNGYQAVLILEGDPVEVWNSYAESFGIDEAASATQSCVVRAVPEPASGQDVGDGETEDTVQVDQYPKIEERFLTEPRVEGENQVECSANSPAGSMWLSAGVGEAVGEPVGHMVVSQPLGGSAVEAEGDVSNLGTTSLRYQRSQEMNPDVQGPDPVDVPSGEIASLEFPADLDPPSLPVAGERIDSAIDSFLDYTKLGVLPDGFSSLVFPVLSGQCNSGLFAVVQYDGSPGDAVAAFKAVAGSDESYEGTFTDLEDREVEAIDFPSAGGYHIEMFATETSPGATTMLYFECGD